MIKFVYFDIGGVLVDWSGVFKTAAGKFNLNPSDISNVFQENHIEITKGIMSSDDFWKKCIQKYKLQNTSGFDFLDSWVSDYKPINITHDFVGQIKNKYKIGLLSNIYKGMLPLLINKKLIPDIVYDQIVFSCDVGMMKPDPEIFELAEKRAGRKTNELLLVDDREDYLEGAEKLNWNVFLFEADNPKVSVEKLRKYLKVNKKGGD